MKTEIIDSLNEENQQNQTWLFENIDKIDKPLARLTKNKRKCVYKFSNLDEENQFLETHSAKIQEEINSLNKPTYIC